MIKTSRAMLCALISLCMSIMPSLTAFAEVKEPQTDAKGAILMEYDTGRVLYEKNADTPLANASTTKIMTALVVIENNALSDVVTASKKASLTPPVKMYLEEGEKQTVETLLYALMLESANDAAVALAEHTGGSVEGFADMMNKKARELGAENTNFVTPNGLDAEGHQTTAKDMAIITRHALKNDDFRRIIKTPHVQTPVGGGNFKQHAFVNKDRLLNEYEGALGVKTGYTGNAGHCFVGAAKRNGMMIISVALGSGWGAKGKEQKWIDTKRLLNYGFENYTYSVLANEGDLIKTAEVLNSKGETVALRLKNGITLPLTKDEEQAVNITSRLPAQLDAPITSGQTVGYASVLINGKAQAKIDIVADADVARCDFKISAGKILDAWFNMDLREIYQ